MSGVKTLLLGASTSFLLSFGDSLPSWCCLESLLGAHTLRVKRPAGAEGKLLRWLLSDSREMQTCLPAFLGFPVHSVEQRWKMLRPNCFKDRRDAMCLVVGGKCSDCSWGEARLGVPRLPCQAGMKRCVVPREGKSYMLELGVWQEVLLSTAICLLWVKKCFWTAASVHQLLSKKKNTWGKELLLQNQALLDLGTSTGRAQGWA